MILAPIYSFQAFAQVYAFLAEFACHGVIVAEHVANLRCDWKCVALTLVQANVECRVRGIVDDVKILARVQWK